MNRLQLKEEVIANIGRDNSYLVSQNTSLDNYINSAYRLAVQSHPFRDICDVTNLSVSEDDDTVYLLPTDVEIANLISAATLYDEVSVPLRLRGAIWWSIRIVEASERHKSRPQNGFRRRDRIIVDRPVEEGTKLTIVYSYIPVLEEDSDENPIPILETFIIEYVTSKAFLRLENFESFTHWKRLALGYSFEQGKIAGSLKQAILADSFDVGEDVEMARVSDGAVYNTGLTIRNLENDSIKTWY
jgi:hypothetical protein